MRAVVAQTGRELATSVQVADSLFARMRGLLGRDGLNPGEALWIKPCNSIHTIGMRFAIDAVFLDKQHQVVAIVPNLTPNRLSWIYFRAASVLELPAGTIASMSPSLTVGAQVAIARTTA